MESGRPPRSCENKRPMLTHTSPSRATVRSCSSCEAYCVNDVTSSISATGSQTISSTKTAQSTSTKPTTSSTKMTAAQARAGSRDRKYYPTTSTGAYAGHSSAGPDRELLLHIHGIYNNYWNYFVACTKHMQYLYYFPSVSSISAYEKHSLRICTVSPLPRVRVKNISTPKTFFYSTRGCDLHDF
jgi:hypothetical protein